MSNLTLDGSTSFIGTEFIKLLATGSSNLATEEYVDDAIAEGGGGGNVDLSNYYTQTETDNLLNNKLNVNNPQDITGNLRLDPTNGLSKIILNAVSPPNANDDFYCNGSGQFNGTLRVSVLTSDGDINADGCNADTFNSHIITNDIVFKHNDVEYMRFNATNDTIDLSKELNLESSTLKINSISTNGLNDMTFNVDTLGEFLRFNISDFTVRVPDNRSFLSQNIFTDIIKPLAFANDVSLQGKNTTSDGYEEYVKINSTDETVDFNKDINVNENVVMLPNKTIYLDEGATNRRYIRSSARTSPSVQNHLDIVQENTSIGRIRLMIGSEENVIVENSQLYSKRVITAVAGVKSNTYNSNGDFDTVFQRNNIQYLALDKFTEDATEKEAIICSKQLRANNIILNKNLQINQFQVVNEYVDFRLENANNSIMRFFVGNSTSVNLQISQFVNGNSELVNEILLNRATKCSNVFHSNTIDTYTDTGLSFRRNGNEYFKFEEYTDVNSGNETYPLINVEASTRLSTNHIYITHILNRAGQYDNTFQGSNAAGTARVEYMRWNYADQSLDFNAPIDNTNIAVIGNIVDTTVSDERLKTNIQDIESNYCDCIKNVKIKTVEYTDEKYKDNDRYGFIAQNLQKHLPKEFKNIVKETKPKKDEGEAYLSINYIKLSLVLWGALQETLTKVEHLEASMYEMMEDIKELKGKKPKAKAKSKEKSEK